MAESDSTNRRVRLLALSCSVGFFMLAIAALAGVAWVLVTVMLGSGKNPDGVQAMIWISMLSAMVGYILLRVARDPDSENMGNAVPLDARALLGPVLEKSPDPIGDWTRLVGLTGGTGVFRKLELSGMPLATILMTVLFFVLGLLAPVLPKVLPNFSAGGNETFDGAAKIFFDMAKLTLGAFIGSFVTKGNSRDTEATKEGAAAAVKAVVGKLSGSPPPKSPAPAPGPGPAPVPVSSSPSPTPDGVFYSNEWLRDCGRRGESSFRPLGGGVRPLPLLSCAHRRRAPPVGRIVGRRWR